MEITLRKNINGFWKTMSNKLVSEENAKRAFWALAKKVDEFNAECGERKYAVDCINCETGEVVYHN